MGWAGGPLFLFVRDAQLTLPFPASLSYVPDHLPYVTFPQAPACYFSRGLTIPSQFLVLSTTS